LEQCRIRADGACGTEQARGAVSEREPKDGRPSASVTCLFSTKQIEYRLCLDGGVKFLEAQ
jgi:hypothetical protein